MNTERNRIRASNLDFYEKAYSVRSLFGLTLKQLISYDQLSKTRRNLKLLRRLPGFSSSLSILDYGFGHGTLLLRLPRTHRISGCELSSRAVENLKSMCRLLHRNAQIYSQEDLGSAKSISFDLVCCSHVIEHVEDDTTLLIMFHRILGPDGHLLLNIPINEVWKDPNHVRCYSMESVRTILHQTGFIVLEAKEADRWTAWILSHEQVSSARLKPIFRITRLLLALLPVVALDTFERFVPEKFKFQQLLVLAKKK